MISWTPGDEPEEIRLLVDAAPPDKKEKTRQMLYDLLQGDPSSIGVAFFGAMMALVHYAKQAKDNSPSRVPAPRKWVAWLRLTAIISGALLIGFGAGSAWTYVSMREENDGRIAELNHRMDYAIAHEPLINQPMLELEKYGGSIRWGLRRTSAGDLQNSVSLALGDLPAPELTHDRTVVIWLP